jgi:nucleoside 2-deoxyribosyltransferase
MPEAEVYDPYDGHETSVHYDTEKGESVFRASLEKIGECDLMIAFIPVASMGTAIEMWECRGMGIPIWSITEMQDNWVVRFCSEMIFSDIESLADHLDKSLTSASKEG